MEINGLEILALMGFSSIAGIALSSGVVYYSMKKSDKYDYSSRAIAIEPGPNAKPIDQDAELKKFRKY